MTGNDALKQALNLLNYTDANGNISAANNANLTKRALPLINQIYADLWEPRGTNTAFSPLKSLGESLDLDSTVCFNVLPYGVAMMLAASDGDADNQSFYAQLYNQRRPSAFKQGGRIQDRLPRTFL